MGLFVVSRFLHSILAGLFCYLLLANESVQAWLAQPLATGSTNAQSLSWLGTLTYFSELCIYTILAWAALAVVVYIIRSLSIIRFKA